MKKFLCLSCEPKAGVGKIPKESKSYKIPLSILQSKGPRLERRKIVGKVEDSVPEERNYVCAFGTKEFSKTFPEER